MQKFSIHFYLLERNSYVSWVDWVISAVGCVVMGAIASVRGAADRAGPLTKEKIGSVANKTERGTFTRSNPLPGFILFHPEPHAPCICLNNIVKSRLTSFGALHLRTGYAVYYYLLLHKWDYFIHFRTHKLYVPMQRVKNQCHKRLK